jgi:hypothetical protein
LGAVDLALSSRTRQHENRILGARGDASAGGREQNGTCWHGVRLLAARRVRRAAKSRRDRASSLACAQVLESYSALPAHPAKRITSCN